MPWDSIDRWRDEDGTPPPHLEARGVDWWREAFLSGAAGAVCDALVQAELVKPPARLLDVLIAAPLVPERRISHRQWPRLHRPPRKRP